MSNLLGSVKELAWLNRAIKTKAGNQGVNVRVLFVGRNGKVPARFMQSAPPAIKKKIKAKSSVESWVSKTGPCWVIQTMFVEAKNHNGLFSPSPFSMARDLMGACFRQMTGEAVKSISIDYVGGSKEELQGLAVGIELSQYRFKKLWPKAEPSVFKVKIKSDLKAEDKLLQNAAYVGEAVNLARFLVDLPPNALGPKQYAEILKLHFSKKGKTKVEIWNEQRLKKEKMGLHIAVGQGSTDKSCMVHVEYRNGGKAKPVAFVGKGITFDSGGLDLKPASGMRLMKKDMGGSASVAGVAHWVIQSKLKVNCDFYFAIAENAVNENSFRPGDILTSRLGKTVEIHNTDAEGRLVLADVLTVAAEKKPELLIDIATLTGAIKYGLGANTPGMFSSQDNLAESLLRSGQARGDVFWRMPLIPEERSRLKSEVADMVNCTDGFGGAITAALFLESFTGGVPWAHFDIYAWTGRGKGALSTSGGTGQIVQAMTHFLEEFEQNQKS